MSHVKPQKAVKQKQTVLVAGDKNSGRMSPVQAVDSGPLAAELRYDQLDVVQTKAEYLRLRAEIDRRVDKVADCTITLQEAAAYFRKMQALLSQRGADRKKILQRAGCPGWTTFAEEFSQKVGRSVRHLRRLSSALCNQTTAERKKRLARLTPLQIMPPHMAMECWELLKQIVAVLETGEDTRALLIQAKSFIAREEFRIASIREKQNSSQRMLWD